MNQINNRENEANSCFFKRSTNWQTFSLGKGEKNKLLKSEMKVGTLLLIQQKQKGL